MRRLCWISYNSLSPPHLPKKCVIPSCTKGHHYLYKAESFLLRVSLWCTAIVTRVLWCIVIGAIIFAFSLRRNMNVVTEKLFFSYLSVRTGRTVTLMTRQFYSMICVKGRHFNYFRYRIENIRKNHLPEIAVV